MVKYLKTEINPKLIEVLLRRYMQINKGYVKISDKLVTYLNEKYKLNLGHILNEMITNLRVGRIKENLVQIYVLDKKIDTTTLWDLLQLIEYGNREIGPCKAVSKLLNKSLMDAKNYLTGV